MSKPKLYIFDISNVIHRAFHAMAKNNLSTADGFPTGAIYGTFNILAKFIADYKPENILICYDAQTGESVRKDMYPLYKSNRAQVNAVSAQELVIRKMIELLGMASVVAPGYEADDLIGTATSKYKDKYDVVIVSGDKDLLCHVRDDNVRVLDLMKNKLYKEQDVVEKLGVKPQQVVSYLGLVGDAADCIPGVKGIGAKGAAKLLNEYGDINGIYDNIDDIKGTLQKKLIDGEESAILSHNLAFSYWIDFEEKDLSFRPQTNKELIDLFSRLEFDSSLNKLSAVWRLYEQEKT